MRWNKKPIKLATRTNDKGSDSKSTDLCLAVPSVGRFIADHGPQIAGKKRVNATEEWGFHGMPSEKFWTGQDFVDISEP